MFFHNFHLSVTSSQLQHIDFYHYIHDFPVDQTSRNVGE